MRFRTKNRADPRKTGEIARESGALCRRPFEKRASRRNIAPSEAIPLFCEEERDAIRNGLRGAKSGKARRRIAKTRASFPARGGRGNWNLPGRDASRGCGGVPGRRQIRWRIWRRLWTRMGKMRSRGRIALEDRFPPRRLWL